MPQAEQREDLFSLAAQSVEAFRVMNVLEKAQIMQAQGKSVIHLEVGEPDFPTPEPIASAGKQAITDGQTRYTAATGIPALRQAIADYYQTRYHIDVPYERIMITAGASGALQLLLMALCNPGDQVMIADPSYPCYRQLLTLYGMQPLFVPLDAEHDFQLTAEQVEKHWQHGVKALLIASPANPTGSMMSAKQLSALYQLCRRNNAVLIVDEIYQGLVYEAADVTALSIQKTQADTAGLYVFNSFSKYFGMTGWRLGWLVAPSMEGVKIMARLAQNLFISASAPAQYAALAAFSKEALDEMERRRAELGERRDFLIEGITQLGFKIMGSPDGAFYLFARLPDHIKEDSEAFVFGLLKETGVALAPGTDFGIQHGARYVRFAYTQPVKVLDDALQRIGKYIKQSDKPSLKN